MCLNVTSGRAIAAAAALESFDSLLFPLLLLAELLELLLEDDFAGVALRGFLALDLPSAAESLSLSSRLRLPSEVSDEEEAADADDLPSPLLLLLLSPLLLLELAAADVYEAYS